MCHGLVPPNGTEMEHEIQFRRFPVQRKLSHLYCSADIMKELSYLPLKGRVTSFPSRFARFVSSPVEIRTKHSGPIMGFEEWPERFRGSRGGRKGGEFDPKTRNQFSRDWACKMGGWDHLSLSPFLSFRLIIHGARMHAELSTR